MVSNDVEALGPGEACEALFLTPKARVIAPMIAVRRAADDFLLLTEAGLGERLRVGLDPHAFRGEVRGHERGARLGGRLRRG